MNCGIIEDLLPLYLDGVCTEQSKQEVTEHLQQCPRCRKMAGIVVRVPETEPDSPKADRAVKRGLRRIRHRWWASIIVLVACIPVFFLGWNEYSAQGVAYSNLDELRLSDRFMQCLVDGNYAKAFNYMDVDDKKQTWLENWFDEEKLTNMEADGLAKFCQLGEKVEQQLGGFESYEYVGTTANSGFTRSGEAVHQVTYRVRIGTEERILLVNVSQDKVSWIDGGGNFLTDPLAQLCIWGEYLWQDYEGCYYDAQSRTYVYYDEK